MRGHGRSLLVDQRMAAAFPMQKHSRPEPVYSASPQSPRAGRLSNYIRQSNDSQNSGILTTVRLLLTSSTAAKLNGASESLKTVSSPKAPPWPASTLY